MSYQVPLNSVSLMRKVYGSIFPAVDKELAYWHEQASQIPNNELRNQALASLKTKRFHCEGGAVYALLAGDRWEEALQFIIAYQTTCDYLDNLCDRSTSLDPDDFRLLHQSLKNALLNKNNESTNYYALRQDQDDGQYLTKLVKTCQQVIQSISGYNAIVEFLMKLESMYTDLQVHKHVAVEERVPRLTKFYDEYKNDYPSLHWYEFSAAAGSTLGIFCIISLALHENLTKEMVQHVYDAYFPYVQGLHILLDYYIDQKEDMEEGDLNFCTYYPSEHQMRERFLYMATAAKESVLSLPLSTFHQMVCSGLIGLYLSDQKVQRKDQTVKHLLKAGGKRAKFFNWNMRVYRKAKNH